MPYTIDRFEDNDLTVLETDDGTTLDVPRAQLPADAQEGDVLVELAEVDGEVRFAVDVDATEQRRREVSDLRASLPTVNDGDLEL